MALRRETMNCVGTVIQKLDRNNDVIYHVLSYFVSFDINVKLSPAYLLAPDRNQKRLACK